MKNRAVQCACSQICRMFSINPWCRCSIEYVVRKHVDYGGGKESSQVWASWLIGGSVSVWSARWVNKMASRGGRRQQGGGYRSKRQDGLPGKLSWVCSHNTSAPPPTYCTRLLTHCRGWSAWVWDSAMCGQENNHWHEVQHARKICQANRGNVSPDCHCIRLSCMWTCV